MYSTFPHLQSIANFRDVGAFINAETSTQPVRLNTSLLFRGARPDEASTQDRRRLVEEYGVRSIIDLRTKTEHIEQAQKWDAKIRSSAALFQSNEEAAEPLKIPGITYHEINFNGSAFSRMLISKLSWWEFSKLMALMAFGYRLEGIRVLAPHLEAMGLEGLAIESLEACKYEVKQIFDVLSQEEKWPIMIHCTQGKDRTGLVIMLILFLLGVDSGAVEADYLLSGPELEPEKAERMKEISSTGLSEHFTTCPPDLVAKVNKHLHQKYGGVDRYLLEAQVTTQMQENVREILLKRANV
ncbi:hypothetical protein CC78DRAFT_537298 [Lojkania enalia]|uniref:Tyrosine specific protein phosphatases domain-containing protein n=1 Tax=Lojkania enalia TaxID=147567 RepID=A0A9P4K0H1_9PLEO|nr:hypothetical protein CC78DRAFT_537298 [Didymosphaeria enalia]